jgi:hypothetical protein
MQRLTDPGQMVEIIVIYCNPVRRVLFDESDFWREYPLRWGSALTGWAVYRLSTQADHC